MTPPKSFAYQGIRGSRFARYRARTSRFNLLVRCFQSRMLVLTLITNGPSRSGLASDRPLPGLWEGRRGDRPLLPHGQSQEQVSCSTRVSSVNGNFGRVATWAAHIRLLL